MKPCRIATIALVSLLLLICSEPYANPDIGKGPLTEAAQTPNLFELKGVGIEVIFSTTSFSGQPQLTYRDKNRTLTFQGEEIRQIDSEIGLQATVTLEQIPDLRTLTFTLILPAINLNGTETPFQTNAIITTHKTSIGGPDLVRGVLQTYRIKTLRGIAQAVNF